MALIAHERVFHWLSFDTLGVYMRLIVSVMLSLEKCGKIWKNLPFFRAATAGWGNTARPAMARLGLMMHIKEDSM